MESIGGSLVFFGVYSIFGETFLGEKQEVSPGEILAFELRTSAS